MSKKLEPCPFCDGEAYYVDNRRGYYSVSCEDCGIETSNEKGKNCAAKVWNRRAK